MSRNAKKDEEKGKDEEETESLSDRCGWTMEKYECSTVELAVVEEGLPKCCGCGKPGTEASPPRKNPRINAALGKMGRGFSAGLA